MSIDSMPRDVVVLFLMILTNRDIGRTGRELMKIGMMMMTAVDRQ